MSNACSNQGSRYIGDVSSYVRGPPCSQEVTDVVDTGMDTGQGALSVVVAAHNYSKQHSFHQDLFTRYNS